MIPGSTSRPAREHVLFVHAHPDDESIVTGGTIAKLVRDGVPVTVLTCTRGERGDVIPEELRHLEGDLKALADHRETELADAMAALGVVDHRFLGDVGARWRGLVPRRYVDSGMEWGDDGVPVALQPLDPDSLSAGDEADEARDVLAVIADVDATTVITYDDHGGYGHPDHKRVHVIATWAAEEAGVPAYLITTTESSAREAHERVAARGRFPAPDARPAGMLVLPDDAVDLAVDVTEVLDAKTRAIAAHRTQVVVDGDQFALSHGVGEPIGAVELFRSHRPAGADGAAGDADLAPRGLQRIGTAAASLVLGLLVGAIGTVAHRAPLAVGGVGVPVGLVLALVTLACLLVAFRLLLVDRLHALCLGLGAVVAVAVLGMSGPGGSVLFPRDWVSQVWAVAPAILVAVVVVWPRFAPRGHARPDGAPGSSADGAPAGAAHGAA
ncbi:MULTISPECIES: PIG-L family deacetylase [Clavibacter]|uniref:Mycothiol biosynthesis protein n=1 Tax=Clavibacter tessellarius TaxID=31965 RepID=A0A154UYJ1_9MICO|nr:PIG-L family deacetylase [Clavibacter michiganensis]KZC94024.1 mycothiol biosynthesis protein [Clavibacter michiganensis subsp. tessellarius]